MENSSELLQKISNSKTLITYVKYSNAHPTSKILVELQLILNNITLSNYLNNNPLGPNFKNIIKALCWLFKFLNDNFFPKCSAGNLYPTRCYILNANSLIQNKNTLLEEFSTFKFVFSCLQEFCESACNADEFQNLSALEEYIKTFINSKIQNERGEYELSAYQTADIQKALNKKIELFKKSESLILNIDLQDFQKIKNFVIIEKKKDINRKDLAKFFAAMIIFNGIPEDIILKFSNSLQDKNLKDLLNFFDHSKNFAEIKKNISKVKNSPIININDVIEIVQQINHKSGLIYSQKEKEKEKEIDLEKYFQDFIGRLVFISNTLEKFQSYNPLQQQALQNETDAPQTSTDDSPLDLNNDASNNQIDTTPSYAQNPKYNDIIADILAYNNPSIEEGYDLDKYDFNKELIAPFEEAFLLFSFLNFVEDNKKITSKKILSEFIKTHIITNKTKQNFEEPVDSFYKKLEKLLYGSNSESRLDARFKEKTGFGCDINLDTETVINKLRELSLLSKQTQNLKTSTFELKSILEKIKPILEYFILVFKLENKNDIFDKFLETIIMMKQNINSDINGYQEMLIINTTQQEIYKLMTNFLKANQDYLNPYISFLTESTRKIVEKFKLNNDNIIEELIPLKKNINNLKSFIGNNDLLMDPSDLIKTYFDYNISYLSTPKTDDEIVNKLIDIINLSNRLHENILSADEIEEIKTNVKEAIKKFFDDRSSTLKSSADINSADEIINLITLNKKFNELISTEDFLEIQDTLNNAVKHKFKEYLEKCTDKIINFSNDKQFPEKYFLELNIEYKIFKSLYIYLSQQVESHENLESSIGSNDQLSIILQFINLQNVRVKKLFLQTFKLKTYFLEYYNLNQKTNTFEGDNTYKFVNCLYKELISEDPELVLGFDKFENFKNHYLSVINKNYFATKPLKFFLKNVGKENLSDAIIDCMQNPNKIDNVIYKTNYLQDKSALYKLKADLLYFDFIDGKNSTLSKYDIEKKIGAIPKADIKNSLLTIYQNLPNIEGDNCLLNYLGKFVESGDFNKNFKIFKDLFEARLHSYDYIMSFQDKKWIERQDTILIAISTLGLALIASYAITKITTGKAYLFWETTKEQDKAKIIANSLRVFM